MSSGSEHAWQPRGGSDVHTFMPVGLSANQRLLERLEAENALEASAADLVLQIQTLRDALGHPQSKIRPLGAIGLRAIDSDLVFGGLCHRNCNRAAHKRLARCGRSIRTWFC